MVGATQLGLARAAIVVWLSKTAVGVLLAMFVSPFAWALFVGTAHHVDDRWGIAATVVTLEALLGAIGVTFGVGLCGFRIGYASAALALAVGGAVTTVVTSVLVTRASGDPTGIAVPALGPALMPLSLLLGTLLPAFLVNAAASPPAAQALRPDLPPYPPDLPPYSG
jgi:hypothetical protein